MSTMPTSDSIVHPLPVYPPTHTRKSLSPFQLSILNRSISAALAQTILLPPTKRDTAASSRFVSSYVKDEAFQTLHGLIFDANLQSKDDFIIRGRTLLLAEQLVSSSGFEIQDLLDLSIVYAATDLSRMKSIFSEALKLNSSLVSVVENDLVPAFTQSLSPAHGLYAVRKASHCIVSFLSTSPPEIARCFAYNKSFILALASLYNQGLASVAGSYGGLFVLRDAQVRQADEWEIIWVKAKVALIDTFHVIVNNTFLNDIASASGSALAEWSGRAFGIILALLDLPSSSSPPLIPYLDRPLIIDYQQCYSLTKTLASALPHVAEKDARLDLLESTLRPFETSDSSRDPGILKILLRSFGTPPGTDSIRNERKIQSFNGCAPRAIAGSGKGKGKAPAADDAAQSYIPDIDIKISQVLDILPDYPPEYIRALLEHPPFDGNPECVIEVLLEGNAPNLEELESRKAKSALGGASSADDAVQMYVLERRNIFDDDAMDLTRLRVGKKNDDDSILKDRSFMEQMKANILRWAEAMSDDEDEDEDEDGIDLAYEDEEIGVNRGTKLNVGGDGEDEVEDEAEEDAVILKPPSVETMLELVYINSPAAFDRDAATRRSKGRGDLKAQTGWSDEQIEGWRIMLERNPRKDKILGKHEFSGNPNHIPHVELATPAAAVRSDQGDGPHRGGTSSGRGGRGRGRGRGTTGGDASNARDRTLKDKNKASRANHNRKRGHDKKMARAGAGVPP